MITIVDYKAGNLGSIVNMLKRLGIPSRVSSSPNEVLSSSKLILPGVGAFDAAMKNLEASGLRSAVEEVRAKKTPILGLCVGAQIMCLGSEEGDRAGLGWFDVEVKKFKAAPGFKVPHMGWNFVKPVRENVLIDQSEQRFYFVHSYHFNARNPQEVLATTEYGNEFPSALMHENVAGMQFHPEKSHKFGMRLFTNFAEKF